MFSWPAELLLLLDAKGRARRLNLLADKALLAAFADGKKQVSAKHVRLAIRDIGANFSSARSKSLTPFQTVWISALFLIVIGWLASR